MRNPGLAIVAGAACALVAICVVSVSPAAAQAPGARDGQRAGVARSLEATAQSRRRRAVTRLRIERRSLPPNAVRTCQAWYAQEFRPSGTVIVPRMRCRWVAG